MEAMVVHFEDDASEAAQLAQAAGLACGQVNRCASTKDELGLALPAVLPSRVVLYRNFAAATRAAGASRQLLELLLFERLASRQGVSHLTLVAPDLDGEPSGQQHSVERAAREGFLAGLFDAVLTIDPALQTLSVRAGGLPLHHASLASGGCQPVADGPQLLLSRLGSALRNLYC